MARNVNELSPSCPTSVLSSLWFLYVIIYSICMQNIKCPKSLYEHLEQIPPQPWLQYQLNLHATTLLYNNRSLLSKLRLWLYIMLKHSDNWRPITPSLTETRSQNTWLTKKKILALQPNLYNYLFCKLQSNYQTNDETCKELIFKGETTIFLVPKYLCTPNHVNINWNTFDMSWR